MDREEALNKLISVRHHCFVGWRGHDDSYRLAFRDLNRLYVELRDGRKAPESILRGRRGGRTNAVSRDG